MNGVAYNVILSLHAEGKWSVDTIEQLPEGVQPQISVEELIACEKVVKADKKIQELAKEVGPCVSLYLFWISVYASRNRRTSGPNLLRWLVNRIRRAFPSEKKGPASLDLCEVL